MNSSSNKLLCIAKTKQNKQCKFRACNLEQSDKYCKIHYNIFLKNQVKTDKLSIINIDTKKNIFNIPVNTNRKDYCYFINEIIIIQKYLRRYITTLYISERGISIFNKKLCTNESDFLTMELLKNISNTNYFSFKHNNHTWGFDILTFKEITSKNLKNPYNTLNIPDKIKTRFNKLLSKIEKKKKIELEKIEIIDEYISIQQECIEIFQMIDNLKNYTKCKWFLDLNIIQLKELYKQMEDIWNYRLNLSSSEKLNYITNGNLFKLPVCKVMKISDINKLRRILLANFRKLVTEGNTISDRSTASQWILSGLTLVNLDARNTLPWLFQSANIY